MEYAAFTCADADTTWYKSMCLLHGMIFAVQNPGFIGEELAVRRDPLILVAIHNEQVVGYKIGYLDRKDRFYSWIGGVHPEYRGQGIATELMKRQHEWCKSRGYKGIQTKTKNKWRNMLILNLRHGFDVIGTYTDEFGEPKIILEKRL